MSAVTESREVPETAVFTGRVLEYRGLGMSGCGEAVIEIESGPEHCESTWMRREGNNLIVTGDWRPMRNMVVELQGCRVQVRPDEGECGAPVIVPMDMPGETVCAEPEYDDDGPEAWADAYKGKAEEEPEVRCPKCESVRFNYFEYANDDNGALKQAISCRECGWSGHVLYELHVVGIEWDDDEAEEKERVDGDDGA